MLQTSITKWLTKPRAVTQSNANSDAVPLKPQQANKRNNDINANDNATNSASNFPPSTSQPVAAFRSSDLHRETPNKDNGTTTAAAITTSNLDATPALTTLPPLSPHITLAPLIATTLPSFRRLNTLLLEIPYPTKFYDEILTDPVTSSITLAAFWHNSATSTTTTTTNPKNPGILVAGIRCRLLSATCSPDLPAAATHHQQTTTTTPNNNQPHLYIATLSTLSPYRHHGLATHLLAAVTRAAIERHDISAVYAHVWVANEEGLRWYRRRGFAVLTRVEGYYRRLRPSGAWVVWRRVGVGDLLVGGGGGGGGGVAVAPGEERMEGVEGSDGDGDGDGDGGAAMEGIEVEPDNVVGEAEGKHGWGGDGGGGAADVEMGGMGG